MHQSDRFSSEFGRGAQLWQYLQPPQPTEAVAVSLLVGLAISAAWGLFLVGALNLISIAFFVLFIGLGVDFGSIDQFES
jgi:hypothetical protein